jgi:hypothetical protein
VTQTRDWAASASVVAATRASRVPLKLVATT